MSSTDWLGPEDFYGDLIPLIESLGIPWAIAGALAAGHYRATERHTTDADLLVGWHEDLPRGLETLGWKLRLARDPGDPPHLIRAQQEERYVDLLIALTDYQKEALRRARNNVLTVEDVLVHKIIAWRGRDRDDIESILTTGLEIDWDYVRRWVAYFGLEERLSQPPLPG